MKNYLHGGQIMRERWEINGVGGEHPTNMTTWLLSYLAKWWEIWWVVYSYALSLSPQLNYATPRN